MLSIAHLDRRAIFRCCLWTPLSGRKLEGLTPSDAPITLDNMPVPKPRRDDRVEYVVVRRTNVDGEEVADFDSASDPTPTVKALLDRPDLRRQPQSAPTDSEFDADDDDDDDDYPSPTEGPSPVRHEGVAKRTAANVDRSSSR